MLLILRVHTYRNQPASTLAAARYSAIGGTLGRSSDNDLVLEDPGKYISRTHAKVAFRDGCFFLADVGSNPSIVNDRPLGQGREILLGDGDRIVIGDYQLEARLEEEQIVIPVIAPAPINNPALPLFEPPPLVIPEVLQPLAQRVAPVLAAQPALRDALAGARILDLGTGFSIQQDDPLGLNLFGTATSQAPHVPDFGLHDLNPPRAFSATDSDHVSPERASFALPPVAPTLAGRMAIPDDYDPLADFAPRPAATVPSPLETLLPAAPVLMTSPPPATANLLQPVAMPDTAPYASPQSSMASPATESEILQALLRGLGLPDLKLDRSGAELAENVGAMLREATAGTMDVLMARALTKKESRIDMTMMAVRSNNPLKFFPNVDSAMTQLLTNTMAGYMPSVQAMGSAFDDLKAHELSVIAGMRAALESLLLRFDPSRIEQRTPAAGMMDKMGGGTSRKAKMWDQLVEVYAEVTSEVDDVQGLFGDKFSAAYEEQVDRLRRGGK
jgi:type VI secretion system FHA domain protein